MQIVLIYLRKHLNMKPVLSLATALFVLCITAVGQNNTLEVSVSDTALVKADYFVFRIQASPDMGSVGTVDTTGMRSDPTAYYRRQQEKQRQMIIEMAQQMENKIKNLGFTIEPTSLGEIGYRSSVNSWFNATTNSIKSVHDLLELIKTERSVNINILQLASKEEDAVNASLLKKLMAKARERAQIIAATMGKKVLAVVSMSDRKSDQWNGMYTNPTMLLNAIPIRKDGIVAEHGIIPYYPISNSITVKFTVQ
jgi:hypothetical protein